MVWASATSIVVLWDIFQGPGGVLFMWICHTLPYIYFRLVSLENSMCERNINKLDISAHYIQITLINSHIQNLNTRASECANFINVLRVLRGYISWKILPYYFSRKTPCCSTITI